MAQVERQQGPMCEECDIEMHPFAFGSTEGWACQGCGWSYDNEWPERRDEEREPAAEATAQYRVGGQLYVLQGSVLKNVNGQETLPFKDAVNPVRYREGTAAEFRAAVSRVLKADEYAALLASGMNIPDQCVFVAKQSFLENLSPKVEPEDIALIRQTLWHLSVYDGTTGLR